MAVRIAYGIRVKLEGGEWERVKTKTHPKGQWNDRAGAVKVLKDLKARGYVGHIVKLKIRKVSGQPKISVWLKGNVTPISQVPREHRADYRDTLYRAARAAKRYGQPIHINSSYRPYAEQVRLYDLYINHGGPLAAVPGTSDHGRGLALDIPNARTTPKLIKELRAEKLIDDIPSEIWHVTNHAKKYG